MTAGRPPAAPPLLALAALLAAALAVRIGIALAFTSVERPDEVFQTLEPAHRLATGWGITTWEWRDGIRSWLFPGALAVPMRLALLAGLPACAALPVIAASLAAVSLVVVAGATILGWRRSGWAGAAICGIAAAVWPDLVYFAPKTLTEVQGGTLLVAAALLVMLLPPDARRRWFAVIGLLLGLSFCLRFQFAPAILLVAAWGGRTEWRQRWLPMTAGGLVPVAALGLLDWASWGEPFASITRNLDANLVQGRASTYGAMPADFFLDQTLALWGAALAPIVVLFAVGARRAPLLAALAAVVVLSHMLIAHKEISFVHPATVAVILVAGLGTADLVALAGRLALPMAGQVAAFLAIGGWIGLSSATAAGPYQVLLTRNAAFLAATADLHDEPDLCGLGLYGPRFPWYDTGGYTHLDRAVPIYLAEPMALELLRPAANYLLVQAEKTGAVPGYDRLACHCEVCILHRPGTCTSAPDLEINHVLAAGGL